MNTPETNKEEKKCKHSVLSSVRDNYYLCEKCNAYFTDKTMAEMVLKKSSPDTITKIREEFNEWHLDYYNNMGEAWPPTSIVADWWISKLESYGNAEYQRGIKDSWESAEQIMKPRILEELREKIEGMKVIEGMKSSWHKENAHGYNEALNDILSLLTPKE